MKAEEILVTVVRCAKDQTKRTRKGHDVRSACGRTQGTDTCQQETFKNKLKKQLR